MTARDDKRGSLLFDIGYELQRLAFGAPVDKPRIVRLLERIKEGETSPSATLRSEEMVILDAIGKLRNVRATAMELDDHSQGFKDGAQACLNELYGLLNRADGGKQT